VCWSHQLTWSTPDKRIKAITGNLDYPNLSDVESVYIYDERVTFIPDFLLVTEQFPKFKLLGIENSGLKYVERRQLASLTQLTYLELTYNGIRYLPEDVFSDLVNLERLYVSYNHIKVLPPKLLWNLPKLKIFSADSNRIELIPRDFFKNNRELEGIGIDDNKITRIEVDFTLLPKLNYLNLETNTCINEVCYECNIEKLTQIQQNINANCTGIV
jgi:Leucine-rich repeat (LRR) protein